MDRLAFAAWSLDLDDGHYAQALAGVGVLTAARRSREQRLLAIRNEIAVTEEPYLPTVLAQLFQAMHQSNGMLAWRLPASWSRQRDPAHVLPAARIMAEGWRQFLEISSGKVRLMLSWQGADLGSLMTCATVLQHPAVGTVSVAVADMFPSDGRTEWRWPFTLATLPADPLAELFREERERLPLSWPYSFAVADRDHARGEILVCRRSLRETLARVNADRLQRRMALVLLLEDDREPWSTARPLLQALAAGLSADGIALVDNPASASSADLLQALRRVADGLTHNREIDVVLQETFGATVTLLANRDILRLSHLNHTITDLTARLKKLPRNSMLKISRIAASQFGLPDEEEVAGITRASAICTRHVDGSASEICTRHLAACIDTQRISFSFQSEGGEATALSEVSRGVRELEARQRQSVEAPRYIQHRLFRKSGHELVEEQRRLEVGVPVLLKVRIGPSDRQWQAAPNAFPDHVLPKNRKYNRLMIVFHEPAHLDQPLTAELRLPQGGGPSTEATFTFTPRQAAPFQGRITVLHRGRVLQTALVCALVCEPGASEDPVFAITRQIETQVRGSLADLDSRRAFDMAFVMNHTVDERPLLTVVSSRRAWARDLTGLAEPVARINAELSNVATSVADYGGGLLTPANHALFARLARIGANLYARLFLDELQETQSEGLNLEQQEYLQIVSTRPDALVPLEFIYQYGMPDKNATICPHAVDALKNATCPTPCPRVAQPRAYVCPLGFWGLSKVIERHVYNPKLKLPDQPELTVQAEPLKGRDRLDLDQGAVLGYSKEVPDSAVSGVKDLLRQRFKEKVNVVTDWDQWHAAVRDTKPTLLVAFPHNEGSEEDIQLEIQDKFLDTLLLATEKDYVHVPEAAYPLVLLLGCDVAGTAQQYASHVGNFRRAGAAVVLSTIATVFGEHAVSVGEKFISRLLDEQRPRTNRLGELLRDVKREAVAESLPMALCVVAFGDADWRL